MNSTPGRVSLPGQFSDPLDLAALVDLSIFEDCLPLLRALNVRHLEIVDYISVHLARALRRDDLVVERRRGALALLVEKIGEFVDDDSCLRTLRDLQIIPCPDGRFVRPSEAYFASAELALVRREHVSVVESVAGHEEASRRLYEALGVAAKPRINDLLDSVRQIVLSAPSPDTRRLIVSYVEAFAGRSPGSDVLPSELEGLRTHDWLPADSEDARWFRPNELAAGFQRNLFRFQATFVDLPIPVQGRCSGFLNLLGVQGAPTIPQVVRHLILLQRTRHRRTGWNLSHTQ